MARDDIVAADGLIARNNGPWAKDKLSFIDEFVPPALTATQRKLQRCFVDLFAGPGKNIDGSGSGEEFDGSALRALRATAATDPRVYFTHAKLVNLESEDHNALTRRVDLMAIDGHLLTSRSNVELLNDDANHVVHRIMRSIDKRAYVFIIADIEAPKQLQWSTVKATRAHGHQSVDLFVLFPLDMALNRMLSYRRQTVEQSAKVLNSFFGCEEWRPLVEGRKTKSQSAELRRSILELYMSRLRALGWAHVMVVRDVKRRGDSGLYQMIYASNHPAGRDIAAWSAEQPKRRDQLDMFN
jgi:three-Cys-motif partner protein